MNLILGLAVAIASGLLAGMSPCLVPVYPALLHRLTRSKEDPRLITVFFTVGLAGVYFLFYAVVGAAAAFLGMDFIESAETWRGRLTLLGALFSWFMAYVTLRGGINLPAIRLFKRESSGGYFGALATGFVYGSIISPCNAAFIVTGILPAIASSRNAFEGMLLLATFSDAMGLPILFLGWTAGTAMSLFKVLKENARRIELISALFLILAGAYFLFLFTLTL